MGGGGWIKVIFVSHPTFELSWGWVGVVTIFLNWRFLVKQEYKQRILWNMKNTNILQMIYKITMFQSVLLKLDQTLDTFREKTRKHWQNYINFAKRTSSSKFLKGTCQQLQSWDLTIFLIIVTWKLGTHPVILFQLLWTLCELWNQNIPSDKKPLYACRKICVLCTL